MQTIRGRFYTDQRRSAWVERRFGPRPTHQDVVDPAPRVRSIGCVGVAAIPRVPRTITNRSPRIGEDQRPASDVERWGAAGEPAKLITFRDRIEIAHEYGGSALIAPSGQLPHDRNQLILPLLRRVVAPLEMGSRHRKRPVGAFDVGHDRAAVTWSVVVTR